jgi:nitrogen fixation protein FixH
MSPETITSVLGWSMVINFVIFFVWVIAMMLMPNLTYKTQSLVTSITREEFDLVMYKIMGSTRFSC